MARHTPRIPRSPLPITQQQIATRITLATIYDLGQLEKRWKLSRSAVVRKLIEAAVEREKESAS